MQTVERWIAGVIAARIGFYVYPLWYFARLQQVFGQGRWSDSVAIADMLLACIGLAGAALLWARSSAAFWCLAVWSAGMISNGICHTGYVLSQLSPGSSATDYFSSAAMQLAWDDRHFWLPLLVLIVLLHLRRLDRKKTTLSGFELIT